MLHTHTCFEARLPNTYAMFMSVTKALGLGLGYGCGVRKT